ncbi:conserved protein of unknown function [Tenacibaculum soleae]
MNSCSHSQDLNCSDFKTGKFYIPTTEQLEKYTITENDSIKELLIDRDENTERYIVLREKNTQTEWKDGENNGTPEFEIIQWINDCSYRLKYDPNKSELSEQKKWVNENNGIVVEKIRIIGKCMEYRATMTSNDGRKVEQKGTICKE